MTEITPAAFAMTKLDDAKVNVEHWKRQVQKWHAVVDAIDERDTAISRARGYLAAVMHKRAAYRISSPEEVAGESNAWTEERRARYSEMLRQRWRDGRMRNKWRTQ